MTFLFESSQTISIEKNISFIQKKCTSGFSKLKSITSLSPRLARPLKPFCRNASVSASMYVKEYCSALRGFKKLTPSPLLFSWSANDDEIREVSKVADVGYTVFCIYKITNSPILNDKATATYTLVLLYFLSNFFYFFKESFLLFFTFKKFTVKYFKCFYFKSTVLENGMYPNCPKRHCNKPI